MLIAFAFQLFNFSLLLILEYVMVTCIKTQLITSRLYEQWTLNSKAVKKVDVRTPSSGRISRPKL